LATFSAASRAFFCRPSNSSPQLLDVPAGLDGGLQRHAELQELAGVGVVGAEQVLEEDLLELQQARRRDLRRPGLLRHVQVGPETSLARRTLSSRSNSCFQFPTAPREIVKPWASIHSKHSSTVRPGFAGELLELVQLLALQQLVHLVVAGHYFTPAEYANPADSRPARW
jgi:hypothetical protein